MPEEKISLVITASDKATAKLAKVGGAVVGLNQGFELLGKGIRAASAPFSAIINTGADFEKQMSAVKAISATTAKEFKALTDEAKNIGETTAFTATQAGQAMEELRRAGQNTTEVLETTAQAMDLSAATGLELAQAAQLTAVQLNIFKDSGLDAKKAVDLMTQTVGASPQSIQDLSFALDFASGTASAMGMDFQELTSIIGAMADSGVRGGKAGRALNVALARLAAPAKAGQKALAKYGITIDQINPVTNKFADIVDLLNKKGVEQKDLFAILGVETAPKFFKVIQKGSKAFTQFTQKQKDANKASKAASDRLDNLRGDLTLYNSALSGLNIAIFEDGNEGLRKMVTTATDLVGKWTEAIKKSDSFGKATGALADGFEWLVGKGQDLGVGVANLITDFDRMSQGLSLTKDDVVNLNDKFLILNSSINENTEEIHGNIEAILDAAQPWTEYGEAISGATTPLENYVEIMDKAATKTADLNTEIKKNKGFFDTDLEGAGGVAAGIAAQAAGQVRGVGGGVQGAQAGGWVGAIVGFLGDMVMGNKKVQESFKKWSETLGKIFDPVIEALIPLTDDLLPLFEAFIPIIKKIVPLISKVVGAMIKVAITSSELIDFGKEVTKIFENLRLAVVDIAKRFTGLWEKIQGGFDYLLEGLGNVFNILNSGLGNLSSTISNLLTAVSNLLTAVSNLIDAIKNISLGGGGGGGKRTLTNPLGFAEGGLIQQSDLMRVPGMEAGSGLIKAHAGERVTPVSETKSTSNSFTFNIRSIDPSSQKEEIRQLIEDLQLEGKLA